MQNFLEKLVDPATSDKLKKKFDLSKKLDWLIQIGKGMRYLHQKDVIFRDLKPGNILIAKGDVLKLTDFGISKITSNTKQDSKMTKNAGTSFYMAPEVVKGMKYDNSVDVFSFSMVMYQILYETVEPFGEDTDKYGIEFAVSQDPKFRPKIEINKLEKLENAAIPDEVVDKLTILMKRCWDHNPMNRPSFRELVVDFSELQDSLQGAE